MKRLQRKNVVLFDHDGTVVDSETIALKSAWQLTNEVAREFPGARCYDLENFVKNFAGKPYREILKNIYAGSPTTLNDRDIDRLVAEEENRAIERLSVEAKPTEGTLQMLSCLRDTGVEYALVSNSSLRRLNACLSAAGLTEYFPSELVFSANDSLPVRRPKPLPDIYLYASECLEADVLDCIAVEDSLSGIKAAVAAGIGQIVGYIGGTHISNDERKSRADALVSAGAQRVIDRMYELSELLSIDLLHQV
ncbi:MAG: HAD family phosphatase [Oscillatoriaceae cyanobacterium Prado104]|jgi:HAD superfamily hydrolase (TIGR01509 family)|nr:HAD family phosphatase [Oscillatoriaceae cyanobacterium Prado104]